ncbi:MAG: 50S ribosomal protein L9 [Rhodocyclaceae bacterium]|jgi:large subunit ribosomal protein L9|nr:50S ribosomal protein L9 [Rhodocyclaceae bacterium]MDO9602364.1 50S ribosomal protein L9 [Rhodocyclaceae bacterium]MDP2107791.1 50S ribosomal protein L9 [Rhodocyclaceae bacterium]MDP2196082.1 50S ribosomal protein L9 [Rhodocyclaceae bacterium]
MQVILMDKVVNLGGLGDVVKVKEGYARNFLIPKGFAKRATPENMKVFEARRAELERLSADKLTAAQAVAARLEGLKVEIARKAGVDGRLFGSVSPADVAEALTAQGVATDKSAVRMPEGLLKTIGEFVLEVSPHADVVAKVTVVVVGEQ